MNKGFKYRINQITEDHGSWWIAKSRNLRLEIFHF